jgi:C-terminal processing protease CtpA/Prc
VLLLLGAGSLSSSEDFASAMRELPHVSLVGDASGGASANPATRALAGGWSYTVSRWWFQTADGLTVEGAGIPPHVAVAAGLADFAAGRDPVLDYAEAWAAAPVVVRPP